VLGKCKDVEKEVENYGITGKWNIVINAETGDVDKVMKSGDNILKFPVYSLN